LVNSFQGKLKFKNVKGIAHKEGNIIKETQPQTVTENLDDIPSPAWHLLPLELYPRKPPPPRRLNAYPMDSHNTSRGCPFNCRFCSLPESLHRTFRTFSPERMLHEIRFLKEKYGTKGLYFREDNFTVSKKRVIEFCKLMIKEKMDIQWICESRVDLVNLEMLQIMKDAGCNYIWFGVESGSNRVLQMLNKGISIKESIKCFQLCKKAKIDTGASFMIGVPGETIEEIKETIKFERYLFANYNVDCFTNIFAGVPTSPIYQEIIEQHLYTEMEEGGICEVATPEFNRTKLENLLKTYKRKLFYRNPKVLYRLIKRRLGR
jgi:radical SAM superfamily enzyme YgiQ (UPF0313 family)